MTTIYIDADACPVKDEVYKVAARYGLKTFVVSNAFIQIPKSPLIERMIVDAGPDVADDWIAEHVLVPEELEAIRDLPDDRKWIALLVRFSVKEAVYKALDPYVHRYVGFHEAIVRPDVYSIGHTSVEAYLCPIVHEIKVRRADLLGDLRREPKRAGYQWLSSETWYVLAAGIAEPEEVPPECGVMLAHGLAPGEAIHGIRLEPVRAALHRDHAEGRE